MLTFALITGLDCEISPAGGRKVRSSGGKPGCLGEFTSVSKGRNFPRF